MLTQTRDDEAKRKVVNRLRRAHGQLAAVIAAVEHALPGGGAAARRRSKALDHAGFLVISSALQEWARATRTPRASPIRTSSEKRPLSLA